MQVGHHLSAVMNFAMKAKSELAKMIKRAEAMEIDSSEANKRILASIAEAFEKEEARARAVAKVEC